MQPHRHLPATKEAFFHYMMKYCTKQLFLEYRDWQEYEVKKIYTKEKFFYKQTGAVYVSFCMFKRYKPALILFIFNTTL